MHGDDGLNPGTWPTRNLPTWPPRPNRRLFRGHLIRRRDPADSDIADLVAAADSEPALLLWWDARRLGHRRLGVCFASEFALLRSLLCFGVCFAGGMPGMLLLRRGRLGASAESHLVPCPSPLSESLSLGGAESECRSPAGPERATSGHSSGGGAGPGRGGLKKASIAQVEGRGAVSRAIARKDSRTHPGGGPHPRTHPFNINWSVYYPPRPRPAPPPLLRPDEGPTRARLAGAPGRRRVSRVRLL